MVFPLYNNINILRQNFVFVDLWTFIHRDMLLFLSDLMEDPIFKGYINIRLSFCSYRMAKQLTDFECQVIVLFKEEHLMWRSTKCAKILPEFFSHISRYKFSIVVSRLSEFLLGNLYIHHLTNRFI